MDVAGDLASITNAEVSAITLDHRVTFQLLGPNDPLLLHAYLVFGVPFEYRTNDRVMVIDPEQPHTLFEAWRWLRQWLHRVMADDALNLTIEFGDASMIYIRRHPAYEAWELHGKGVRGILAGPL